MAPARLICWRAVVWNKFAVFPLLERALERRSSNEKGDSVNSAVG